MACLTLSVGFGDDFTDWDPVSETVGGKDLISTKSWYSRALIQRPFPFVDSDNAILGKWKIRISEM